MKNQIVKRMLAGSMAVVVGAGCAGAYAYHNQGTEITVYAQEDKEELKEAAEEVLSDSSEEETKEFFKEESVYVKADASGKAEETTVTEWLKNAGRGEVKDQSELQNIENIKGEEEFTEGNGGELTWKSEGEDIYYQGTTDKELPVEVKISYKLDGKDITAENLKGKDGKVEIHIDYVNKSKEKVSVNEEETEMYTPFTMVTALMLPTEEYQNVKVDNGKVISDADRDIVVGLAFPGLKENLKLEEMDVDIPESVTITADVKNASIGPAMTVASADVIDKLGFDKVNDFDSFEESINELDSAALQLVNGSREAADGSKTLADGSKTLADGSKTLADGVNTLNDKGAELIAGVNTLADGVNEYTGGVGSLAAGSTQLLAGAGSVHSGAQSLNAGIGSAYAGAAGLKNGIELAGQKVSVAMTNLSDGLNGVNGALDGAITALGGSVLAATADVVPTVDEGTIVADAMTYVPVEGMTDEQIAAVRSAVTAAVQEANANQQAVVTQTEPSEQIQNALTCLYGAKAGIGQIQGTMQTSVLELNEGLAQLSGGAKELTDGLGVLAGGSAQLVSGTESLTGGAQALADGAAALNASSSLLTAGTSKLQEGGAQLISGTGQLADGANTLADGSKTLADGANTLAAGNQTLADGMSEFKTSGIDKLTEVFNGDIKNLTARLDVMGGLGEKYVSFAGIGDGTKGSTKFIIETKGVE